MRKLLLIACLIMLQGLLYAQERTISGQVVDDNGESLPGVNVVLKGSTQGTITDLDGNYKVPLNGDDDAILVFSFIGMQTKELPVGGRSVLDVTLSQDVTQLTEVVVTAFGVEREKKALGYSVQDVKSDELTKTDQTSVLNSLQGKVAGAQISNAGGAIGSSTRIVLRGPTSLLGNNQALIVVDGVPINNGTSNNVQASGNFYDNIVDAGNRANDINPENIESVSVLKGPAAAALYGSRAANGVVLITTKKGTNTAGKTNINFNSSYTWSKVYIIPKMQNKFGQGQFGDNQNYLFDQESWGDAFDGSLRPYGAVVNNIQRYKPYEALPSNVQDFWETGNTFQNSLSLSGGNADATYFLSFNDMQQNGVMINTDMRRNNLTFNGSANLGDKVTTSASINYVRTKANLPMIGQRNQALAQVYNMPRDMSVVDMKDLDDPFNTPDGFFTSFIVNPYYSLKRDFSSQDMNRIFGNVQLAYAPVDWISGTLRVGSDVIADQRNTYHDLVQYQPGSPNAGAAFNSDGEYTEQRLNTREINVDAMVNVNRDLMPDLQLNVLVGYNFNQRETDNLFTTIDALTLPRFPSLSNVSGSYTSGGIATKRRLYGVYGSADLSYKGYLFLGATYRTDWSSTLPLDNNSFSYPSVNLGFVFTDAFEITNNILSFGKVRLSYAEVGNDAGTYLTNSVFQQTNIGASFATIQFPFNNGTVIVPGFSEGNTIGNPNLQPEITKAYEAGIDIRLFNGRVGIDATYYNSTSESQILNTSVAPSSGFTTQVVNIGKISNKGVELQLNTTPLKIGAFRWDLSVNYTKNVNRVEELDPGNTELVLVAQGLTPGLKLVIGKPYGVFEATQALKTADGKVVVGPDGIPLDDPDPVEIGSIQPDWYGGATSTFSYKGLSLGITMDTRQGGKVVSSTAAQLYFAGLAEETAFNDREEWIVPNSVVQTGTDDDGNPIYSPNSTPLTMYGTGNVRNYWSQIQGGSRNEAVLLDASYLKLREVALRYTIPTTLISKTPFKGITVGAVGRNLWLRTQGNNHFIDPEASAFGNGNAQGYEFLGIPPQATYGFDLKIKI
ncbi:SusC/RagA family TonB-linked outer membrane protein [Marinoscillum luteum]|uniref:SusC/RagA family TonB-linked outer membrane protein n=1 Tax=Marinoscillum luteum TaxID=861051 RepID=A0ABW7N2K0_9BACT